MPSDLDDLLALDTPRTPPRTRAAAVVDLAFALARRRTGAALDDAAARIARAQELPGLSRLLQARLAHAEGYVRYQQGQAGTPVVALNRAIALFPPAHRLRPRVFDTLGQYFLYTVGDLDRARDYFQRAYREKEALVARDGIEASWEGLAITAGNLGRLEVSLERWAEAARWTKIDLDLETRYGGKHGDTRDEHERRRVRAMLLGQLARIELGRGARRARAARDLLRRAFAVVPDGAYTEITLRCDLARAALALGDVAAAEAAVAEAERRARAGDLAPMMGHVHHARGLVLAATHDGDLSSAAAAFRDAMASFDALNQPQEYCEAASRLAALFLRADRRDDARTVLLDAAIPRAERSLFGQLQPLARLEELLASIDPGALALLRQRRMLGGIAPDEHTGRLRGERRQLTVWTCDIRGFAAYCDAHDDAEVVATLNRFFRATGERILAAGGKIDKYVGDNILAYFADATRAAQVAVDALAAVDALNTEWAHLDRPTLAMGIGIATGEAVVGSVGFAGKLEHTIIGSTVNLACRLVGVAGPGEVAVDDATRRAVGRGFTTRPLGRTGRVSLKGFGLVRAWLLGAPPARAPRPRTARSPRAPSPRRSRGTPAGPRR